jgi:hypothetical protein
VKQCFQCKKWKENDEFGWKNRLLGIRMHICKDCKREYDNAWYQDHKEDQRQRAKDHLNERRKVAREYVFAYLSDHVCEVCAEYRPEMLLLQFDHIRGTKKKNISDMVQSVMKY